MLKWPATGGTAIGENELSGRKMSRVEGNGTSERRKTWGWGKPAEMLEVSYRQAKRLWPRYRGGRSEGAAKACNCGGRIGIGRIPASCAGGGAATGEGRYADFGRRWQRKHWASE